MRITRWFTGMASTAWRGKTSGFPREAGRQGARFPRRGPQGTPSGGLRKPVPYASLRGLRNSLAGMSGSRLSGELQGREPGGFLCAAGHGSGQFRAPQGAGPRPRLPGMHFTPRVVARSVACPPRDQHSWLSSRLPHDVSHCRVVPRAHVVE